MEFGIGHLSERIQLFGWLRNCRLETAQNTARKLATKRGPLPNSERETTETSGKGSYRFDPFSLAIEPEEKWGSAPNHGGSAANREQRRRSSSAQRRK
jgi:hypothetical protein